MQAPYDATDGHDDNSYALSVCSGELCRITLAPVQGTDGNTYLKAKSADALEAATTATRRVDGCLLINGSREVLNACDYLRCAKKLLAAANGPCTAVLAEAIQLCLLQAAVDA